MNDITLKRFLIFLLVVIVVLFIAICVAYIITSNDTDVQQSDSDKIDNTIIENNFLNSDQIKEFNNDPNKLLLEFSNCYYEIYKSLLKRNSDFDVDAEVKKRISELQTLVPSDLWVDHYKEQCLPIKK